MAGRGWKWFHRTVACLWALTIVPTVMWWSTSIPLGGLHVDLRHRHRPLVRRAGSTGTGKRREVMSEYGSGCEDCVRCTDCGEVAYCLSQPGTRPCPHDHALCGECNLDGCIDCRQDAELEMYDSGDYDAAADPFYILPRDDDGHTVWPPTTLPETLAEQRADLERMKAESGYDPSTDRHRWGRA